MKWDADTYQCWRGPCWGLPKGGRESLLQDCIVISESMACSASPCTRHTDTVLSTHRAKRSVSSLAKCMGRSLRVRRPLICSSTHNAPINAAWAVPSISDESSSKHSYRVLNFFSNWLFTPKNSPPLDPAARVKGHGRRTDHPPASCLWAALQGRAFQRPTGTWTLSTPETLKIPH